MSILSPVIFAQNGIIKKSENLSTRYASLLSETREMTEDKEGFIWISSNEGLYRFDGHNFHFFASTPANNISFNNIGHCKLVFNNKILLKIGITGGLMLFDPKTENGIMLNQLKSYNSKVKDGKIFYYLPQSDKVWLGFANNGLGLLQNDTAIQTIFDTSNSEVSNRIKWICNGPNKSLIINSKNGLIQFFPEQNKTQLLIPKVIFNGGCAVSQKRYILSSKKNTIYVYDLVTKITTQHTIGNVDETIYEFVKDAKERVYFDHQNKLYVFENNTITEMPWRSEFTVDEITSIFIDKQNYLYVITRKGGLEKITLDTVLHVSSNAQVSITAISANDKYIPYINYANNLVRLQEYENSLTFEFALLNNSFNNIKYRYQLQGKDQNWIYSDSIAKCVYSKLATGTYTFIVECNTGHGWERRSKELTIVIYLPLWKRWFVVVPIILLFVGLCYFAVTKWKQVKHQKIEMRKKEIEVRAMSEADKYKTIFFSNVTHELKTPLTLILLPLEDLLEKNKNNSNTEPLWKMKMNALKLQKQINQLLDVTKIQEGKLQLQQSAFCIVDFIYEIITVYTDLAQQKNITIQYNGLNEEVIFISDLEKIKTIVENLLSNAIKYTGKNGVVLLNMNYNIDKNELQFTIKDNGVGIATSDLEKIFERYYKVDSDENIAGGTGLGLAMVKDFTSILFGKINVESEINKGTQFSLTIPAKQYQPTISNITENTNAADLLIVEDNFELQAYFTDYLSNDFSIIMASDGKEGYQKAIENQPSIIITDIMMPVMNGYELIEKLRADEKTSHIPILIISAKTSADSKLMGYSIGAEDYITKPFNKNELLYKLKNKLENIKKLHQILDFIKQLETDATTILNATPSEQNENKILTKLRTIVEENMENLNFDVDEFCTLAAMSRSQLHNKLKVLTNLSTTDFINSIRLNKSKKLLLLGEKNISEIAFEVGYNSLSYFSRKFTELYGISPTEFKKSV